ncbi:unnamed protein product [Calicophoron daubneyi]|uniref:Ribosome-recycling factor, mitochondrial n=1 Tax=Calicophoron daubneyi TaxID=300641 RepID=A0AAV2TN35_CALDB
MSLTSGSLTSRSVLLFARAMQLFARSQASRLYVHCHSPVCQFVRVSCPVVYFPCRWKSKGGSNQKSFKSTEDQIPSDLLMLIKGDEMRTRFHTCLSNFQSALHLKLTLKLTPQMFAEIPLPDSRMKLGEVANFVLQQPQHQAHVYGDQQLLVDLGGHPELAASARKAVAKFLDSRKGSSSGALIQSAGPSAFTVQLRSVITKEAREELIRRGHEMLNQVKREMDRIYQAHNKLLPSTPESKKGYSEDDMFLLREYLKATVKKQHLLASEVWEQKHAELKAD